MKIIKRIINKVRKINFGRIGNFFSWIVTLNNKTVTNICRFICVLDNLRSETHINDFSEIHEIKLQSNWNKRNLDNLLLEQYRSLNCTYSQKSFFQNKEFKITSQNGEDGLILFLFSLIGCKSKVFIDIGCGGHTSNTFNLAINFGFLGIYLDGDENSMKQTQGLFKSSLRQQTSTHIFSTIWITKENINEIIQEKLSCLNKTEVDILSIDIDGNDYWIWDAINIINPRLVVIEYNASFGQELAVTIPYAPEFNANDYHPRRWYHGASLCALSKLGEKKGYSLICCESNGVNTFFIRNDIFPQGLHALSSKDAFYEHFLRGKVMTLEEQISSLVENYPLVKV